MNYSTLFEIHLRHDYFLNEELVAFYELPPNQQAKHLARYALSDFFEIVPTVATQKSLKNQRMLFRVSGDTLKVAVETVSGNPLEPIIPISESMELHFIIRLKDPNFVHYTNLDLSDTGLFLLTNAAPTTQPALPRMKIVPQSDNSDYLANTARMNPATTAVYAATVEPEQLLGAFGFVSVKMKTSDSDFTIIDDPTTIHATGRTFYVSVENTSYFWKYKKSSDASVFRSSTPLPLVRYGFIELNPAVSLVPPQTVVEGRMMPNPTVFVFEPMEINGNTEICSVIYI